MMYVGRVSQALAATAFVLLMLPPPPCSTLFPYTTLFRSIRIAVAERLAGVEQQVDEHLGEAAVARHHRRRVVELQLRSEEHTSELQSQFHLVCRLLLEKKNTHSRYVPSRSSAYLCSTNSL